MKPNIDFAKLRKSNKAEWERRVHTFGQTQETYRKTNKSYSPT